MTVAPPEPRITRHPDAAAFLAATQAFRAQEPVLTNILGSVAAGVVAGRRYERELWLTVDRPDIVGVAMRTAPWNLSVSPMDEDAARALGRFVAIEDPDLPGITGPRSVVDAVLEGLAPSRTPRTIIIEVARVLADFRPPDPVDGSARRAAVADRDLVMTWHREFGEDVGLPLHELEGAVDTAIANGSLWLWIVDGNPTAMAGHALPVAVPSGMVTRVGPVFTAPSVRGRGYGTAITAHVTARLRDSGATVMLFADAANARTNAIYQRLGFDPYAEFVEVALED